METYFIQENIYKSV